MQGLTTSYAFFNNIKLRFFLNLKSLKLFGLFGFIVSWAQQVTTIIELNILTLCTIFLQMRESNNNNNNNNDSNKEKNIYIRVPQIWPSFFNFSLTRKFCSFW